MSFYEDASLVMIPSGYKDQKVYSSVPTDGSGDLTFSRGSDIEATRVASNGYIEKAKVNLLLQSNTLNTTWTTSNASVTGGQSGYDGSSDAWKLESSTNATESYARQTLSLSGVGTMSIYAKAGNVNFIAFYIASSGPDIYSWFNLSTGATGSGAGEIDKTITSVGGGWYRVTLTGLNPDQRIDVYAANANGSYLTDSGEYIYIQDAQLNYGLVAQEYQETTTTSVVSGITNDMPRLDYSGGASCPSLLLEPSRTNLVEQSEYFGAGNWNLNGSAITTNATTSPEGVANATKLEGDGSGANVRLYDNLTYPSTGDYTFSVYAKAGTNDFILISILGVDGGKSRYFDLVNGIAGDADSKIEAIGTDGWYRCSFTTNLTGPDIAGNFNIYVPYSIDTNSFPSAGDANGQYVYIYGAQLEGSGATYETSYLPTYGTSATRTSESCSKTGISSLIGQTEGTLFAEVDFNQIEGKALFIVDDDSISNYIGTTTTSSGQVRVQIRQAGAVTNIIISSALSLGRHKIAVAYKSGDYALYIDGVQAGVSTSTAYPVGTLNRFVLSSAAFGQLNDGISQALLFPTRLSNADLATLTA